jgi:hypothetical protein
MKARIARLIEAAVERSASRSRYRNSKDPRMVAARRELTNRPRSRASRETALKAWHRHKAAA